MYIRGLKSPCYYHKDCEYRRTEKCHTDECPYGWKEYQEQNEANKQFLVDRNRLHYDLDYVENRNKSKKR